MLAMHGVVPEVIVAHADHAMPVHGSHEPPRARARAAEVDLWLCTPKCAVQLPRQIEGIPVAVLSYDLTLGDGLERALRAAVGR
jgi:hypothetical protein